MPYRRKTTRTDKKAGRNSKTKVSRKKPTTKSRRKKGLLDISERVVKVIKQAKDVTADVSPYLLRAAKVLGVPALAATASSVLLGPEAGPLAKAAIGFLLNDTVDLGFKTTGRLLGIDKEIEKDVRASKDFQPPEEEMIHPPQSDHRLIQDQMRLKRVHGSTYLPQLPEVNKRLAMKHRLFDTRVYKRVVDPELDLTV